MDRYLKKIKATDYDHCIIKEELIISDDEPDDSVHVKIEPIDETFVDTDVKETKSNGQTKRKSGCLGNEIVIAHNDKQSTLDSFLKSKNAKNNKQLKTSNNVTIDEKPKATGKAGSISDNIDALYKRYTKSYCHKCKVKRAVIRRKARCRQCNTQLTYNCESCKKTYGDFTNLGYHLQAHHTDNPQSHPCPVCNKVFTHRKGMQEHRRTIHNSSVTSLTGEQRCPKCGKKFESRQMTEHEKVCDAEPPLKCDKCPYATTYQWNLKKHVYNKHTDFKKDCENCNKTFTNRKSMKRHLRVYCNKVKRFECHHCGHKVYRRDQMMIHLDQVHFGGSLTGKTVYNLQISGTCKFCDKSLEPFERMKYHLRGCESAPLEFRRPRSPVDGHDKSDRTCKYCGLRLKRYEHMRYHLDRCESAPPDCRLKSEAVDQPDLDAAVKNLSKAYCENCKMKTPLKLGKRRCKKCYTLLKCTCERCAKTFVYEKLLLDHLRVKHVKNKKFHQCDKCSRSYSHLQHLILHKKTHHPSESTTKIHKCSKCGRNYENVESLRKHSVYCGKEPKLCCDKCSYKTHFKSSLVDHFRAKKSTCM